MAHHGPILSPFWAFIHPIVELAGIGDSLARLNVRHVSEFSFPKPSMQAVC
jgi:hypothetical protein